MYQFVFEDVKLFAKLVHNIFIESDIDLNEDNWILLSKKQ